MRVALLAITSVIVLASGESGSAVADGKSSSTPPGVAAGMVKAAPERSAEKQVTSRAKVTPGAPPRLERADRPERDGPVLRLLWLLTGSSRRR